MSSSIAGNVTDLHSAGAGLLQASALGGAGALADEVGDAAGVGLSLLHISPWGAATGVVLALALALVRERAAEQGILLAARSAVLAEQEASARWALSHATVEHEREVGEPVPHNYVEKSKVSVSIARGGSLVKLNGYAREFDGGGKAGGLDVEVRPQDADGQPAREKRGGLRGLVGGFSYASRKRLMLLLASVNQAALVCLPLFVTLTYPGEFSPDPKVWKRDIDAFGKRLRRELKHASAVWKLEPQTRGAPHYHLIVFGVPYLDHVWLARVWYEVVGSNDPEHLRAGTEVRRVRSWRGVMSYAAKYLGKVGGEFEQEYVGRWWGIIGGDSLPVDVMTIPIGERAWLAMRRVAWRLLRDRKVKVYQTSRGGVTLFIGAAVGLRLLGCFAGDGDA